MRIHKLQCFTGGRYIQTFVANFARPNGKKLYVPRVEDKNSHMRMLRISRIDDLIANSMDILEPAPIDAYGNAREDVMQANEPVDLFLLPGLAFDKSGRRLGRGGGYYDTFLKNYKDLANTRNWIQPLLVALSYSEQILDEGVIPMTSSDVPIDALVSPAGVIPITTAAINRSMVPLESGAKGDLDSGFFCNNG
ncbi:5-formyltetrahydrofolate cyclo-ligase, mitochondrial isoform X3 [Arachis stenosperma]|uniref:5-formyltetrahydrofolate cyclo-ligase, mitochondrial isoform X3 n=1 Tax=Arachis stenosperma TaxID=217475 RepID=UPI0025ACCCE3|nr:5-formyltetrahydrofolate cyclo-ligase, mitochondrial isoform X3 [Arachis stenosperma]